jgi:hypothetical protein
MKHSGSYRSQLRRQREIGLRRKMHLAFCAITMQLRPERRLHLRSTSGKCDSIPAARHIVDMETVRHQPTLGSCDVAIRNPKASGEALRRQPAVIKS